MKKFISFVMAAAMVASLVPATAFAKGEVTARAKVVDAISSTKDEAKENVGWITENSTWVEKVPELQLTITSTDYRDTEAGADPTVDVTLSLDNAVFAKKNAKAKVEGVDDLLELVKIIYDSDRGSSSVTKWTDNVSGNDFKSPAGKIVVQNPSGATANMEKRATFTDGEVADFLKWAVDMGAEFNLSTVATDMYYDPTPTDDGNDDRVKVIDLATKELVGGFTEKQFIDAVIAGRILDGPTGTTASTTSLANVVLTIGTGGTAVSHNGDDWAGLTPTTTATLVPDIYKAAGWTPGDATAEAANGASPVGGITVAVVDWDEDEVTYRFTGKFAVDDIIIFDLCSQMDKTGVGRTATVSVDSKMVTADDLSYIGVKGRGITATTKKVGSIAEEEIIGLEGDIKIGSTVGDFIDGQYFELKLSKGFEFDKFVVGNSKGIGSIICVDGNTAYFTFDESTTVDNDTITIDKDSIDIESTSAKSGSTCTMTVKATDDTYNASGDRTGAGPENSFNATATVEVLKVVDYKVILSVDEDEDIPVIYSGVNVDNYGITDDSDHMSLEVTAKESFPGAWSMRKGFNFELPEHVYVTDVDVVDTANFYREGRTNGTGAGNVETEDVKAAFWNAYQDGKHVNFEFAKRVFDDVDSGLRDRECAEMTFKLELVADPGFVGDVVLKLTGELVDEQEVTIAKFVSPYEVKAEQNDLIIDYRYTDVPTAITITEAEKGLWAKNEAKFSFTVESGVILFEDDPTFEIDSKSGLEIKDDKASGGTITFTVKTESDEPATVTMKDMQLFMQRSIPAGPYDLEIGSSLADRYNGQTLWAPDELKGATQDADGASVIPVDNIANRTSHPLDADCDALHGEDADTFVGCVADYSTTVKEAFVNVVTAGRDVDDASFTTKVVVPVGENYIVAGEKQIELDTPAYINEAGYTMLPIRAVATALGINNSNVLWDQPTKTVTILYGQRIITMTQGQKVVYVNGSAIPASAAVENTNSRTFLPMRDLATALGVTDITWDQATRTATLNGNQTTSAK